MYKYITAICFLSITTLSFSQKTQSSNNGREHTAPLISRIAFGSCGNQDQPQPILSQAAAKYPNVFVWLGDNIYADTYDLDTIRAKYQRLSEKPEYQLLQKRTRFIATWDDHDYGNNDIGRHYPLKTESKEIFLKQWKAPSNDIRRTREGIYTSYFYSSKGKTVQVIVLDTRTFRDNLIKYDGRKMPREFFYELDYLPHETSDSTFLGEKQWIWLENQLKIPADVRIIASSSQFSISYNGYEAWANFPHERERFIQLIQKTRANGVIFISGDVHYAEISKLTPQGGYPLYDVTSSGITSTWLFATPNENRIEGPIMDNHFGLIDIDWSKKDPTIQMRIYDVRKALRINKTIRLSEIQFKK